MRNFILNYFNMSDSLLLYCHLAHCLLVNCLSANLDTNWIGWVAISCRDL